jgi:large subunit ribosomal protein L25
MDATLKAEQRSGRGKNEARRLRAAGKIPAVVYGTEKNKATEIAVDPRTLLRILHSESGVNTLIGLEGAGLAGGGKVLVKEYQLDPIDHRLLHADFYAVAMDKAIVVTVPIVIKGEPKGVKQQGGIVDFVNREIEVECLPGDIPEHIDIDISELMLHQGIRVRDLPKNDKVKPVSEAEMMIVHVVTIKVEEAPAPAEAAAVAGAAPAAPAEPEVIKKGKKEEEEK